MTRRLSSNSSTSKDSAFSKRRSRLNLFSSKKEKKRTQSVRADLSTPESFIQGLQSGALGASDLIRLGSFPKSCTVDYLVEFGEKNGLRAIFSYLHRYKRFGQDREMRILILRQSALFILEMLKRADQTKPHMDPLKLFVESTNDEQLMRFVRYLRITIGDDASDILLTDFRQSLCTLLKTYLLAITNASERAAKVNLLMRAGLAPTCLWLRRGQKNPQLIASALTLESVCFDAYEQAVQRSISQLARLGGAEAVYVALDPVGDARAKELSAAVAAHDASSSSSSGSQRRGKGSRIQRRPSNQTGPLPLPSSLVLLSAVSHVGVIRMPLPPPPATVGQLNKQVVRRAMFLTGGTPPSAHTHERYALVPDGSDDPIDANELCEKLSSVGGNAESPLELRLRNPIIHVESIVHGKTHAFDVTLDRLEYTTAADLLSQCRELLLDASDGTLSKDDINMCRLFAPTRASTHTGSVGGAGAGAMSNGAVGGGRYVIVNPSTTLVSLPRRGTLRMQLPPRSVNVKFKDGTFVTVFVTEAMTLHDLIALLGEKRGITANRLADYGVFVDDDDDDDEKEREHESTADNNAQQSGGFWLDDARHGVRYLFERADDHQSIRFLPRKHQVFVSMKLVDTTPPNKDAKPSEAEPRTLPAPFADKPLELYFDVNVQAVLSELVDSLSLQVEPKELQLSVVVSASAPLKSPHLADKSDHSDTKSKSSGDGATPAKHDDDDDDDDALYDDSESSEPLAPPPLDPTGTPATVVAGDEAVPRLDLTDKERKLSVSSEPLRSATATPRSSSLSSRSRANTDVYTPRGDKRVVLPDGTIVRRLMSWISLRDQQINAGDRLLLELAPKLDDSAQSVNIWSEETSKETIQFAGEANQKGEHEIVAATLNQLVKYLTSDDAHDIAFTNTFMYTHRSFAPPEVIVEKFMQRFDVPPSLDANAAFIVQTRVCIALKNWLEYYVNCTPDPAIGVFDTIREFVEEDVAANKQCERIAPMLQRQIEQAQQKLEEARKFRAGVDAAAEEKREAEQLDEIASPARSPAPKKNMAAMLGVSFDALDLDALAGVISVQDMQLFEKIEPREFLDSAWTRKRVALAPHLRAFIDRFNYLSSWVSSAICQEELLKDRVRVYEKFVNLMCSLRTLQNFSAIMAIISGLNNSAVLRLKFTKAKLSKRTLQLLTDFEAMMNMEGSYGRYRRVLKKCTAPCVPYVGVSLMDLTFIEEGNPDNIGSLINFAKRRLVVDVIRELESYRAHYGITASPDIVAFLKTLPQMDDKELYRRSLALEPRGADLKDIK
eukprot:CAMPEP_0168579996 /NCGR_PEP_ID=MMETSP0420-20121227/540_1 /TAXON_ID=498008 /ORGANISM="Pessonella sp." /LENGTH=1291 /DNA_ID=CAMNT_0008614041 /DNA_START=42 /DNA_END=3917 /DNA_ORIENTATION=+